MTIKAIKEGWNVLGIHDVLAIMFCARAHLSLSKLPVRLVPYYPLVYRWGSEKCRQVHSLGGAQLGFQLRSVSQDPILPVAAGYDYCHYHCYRHQYLGLPCRRKSSLLSQFCTQTQILIYHHITDFPFLRMPWTGDIPVGPLVKTLSFQRRGHVFNPWSGN